MDECTNAYGQPIGFPVPGWRPRQRPPRTPLEGRTCRIEPLDVRRHAAQLHDANMAAPDGRDWTYLSYGPFQAPEAYYKWAEWAAASPDPFFHAILDRASGRALGVASLMRIDPENGVIEVGHINYSAALQHTIAATEAMYLLMRRVFDELGYRRYEWKCDALNARSRAAALRLGFIYEGIFQQAVVYKGRNRDTAWFAMLDRDWPALKRAYEQWLAPANFDPKGRQCHRLADLIADGRSGGG